MTDDFGEFQFTSLAGGLRWRIDRADPRIRISGQIVRMGLARELAPGAELTSDRLVICGENQRVIYQIGPYHQDEDWYEAWWPD